MTKRDRATSETPNPDENNQLEQMAAMNGAAMGAFTEACQAYVQGVALLNGELAEFMNTRLRRDAELGEALAGCKDLNDVVDLQQGWYQAAAAEYQAETGRLMEMATKVATESWAPVYQRANTTLQSTGSKGS